MPPKIKIVDVVDKEIKNDDAYTITNNEVEESKLPTENPTSETTEETTANVRKKMKERHKKLALIQQLLNNQQKK